MLNITILRHQSSCDWANKYQIIKLYISALFWLFVKCVWWGCQWIWWLYKKDRHFLILFSVLPTHSQMSTNLRVNARLHLPFSTLPPDWLPGEKSGDLVFRATLNMRGCFVIIFYPPSNYCLLSSNQVITYHTSLFK